MNTCHCGKTPPDPCNYCSWECQIEEAKSLGGKEIRPNGLPIVCIKADGTMLEDPHADHPDYLYPLTFTSVGSEVDDDTTGQRIETSALIYTDGSVALTLYEYCYTMWSVRTGKSLGGFHPRGQYCLLQESIEKLKLLKSRRPA